MPQTTVVFYQERQDDVPVLDWLEALWSKDREAHKKCLAAILSLGERGHELRRPFADILRDGIYELRIRRGHVNYRILYFFHGRNVAVLDHALTKEDRVPTADIDRAIKRRKAFEADPAAHSYLKKEL